VMGCVVIALVGRDKPRAFAIGFIACKAVYGGLLWAGGSKEFDPYTGYLPTTKILLPAQRAMTKVTYVDLLTGTIVPDYQPASGVAGMSGGMQRVGASERPPREQFMAVGHLLWADLLATCGALFAWFVEARSKRPAGETCRQ
jgi:hypothetical protein